MNGSEARLALRGLWTLARFDRQGVSLLDPTTDGCRRSFRVYLIALPIFLFITLIEIGSLKPDDDAVLSVLARFLGYVTNCVAFPLAAAPLLRWLGRPERWPQLTTGYNWLALAQYTGLAMLVVLGHIGMPGDAVTLLSVGVWFFSLLVEGFMFEAILETGFTTAAALVLLDLVLSEGIDTFSRSFH